jgi:isopenicillin N synthase-like dioxygenase
MVQTVPPAEFDRYADFDNRAIAQGPVARTALKHLPIIDVSPFVNGGTASERLGVARQIRQACVDIGFFYLVGHGIPGNELEELLEWGHRFFGLPAEEKLKIHQRKTGGGLGYVTPGGLDPDSNPDRAADVKERFIMSREVIPGEPEKGRFNAGESVWPARELLPGFEAFMKRHVQKRVTLAQQLVRGFALSLDLPEHYFDPMYRHLGGTLLFNYYPPLDPARLQRSQWSFSPHTDYGAFTLLYQDALGGLQARNAAGDWIDVPPVEGSFVVNLGDMFAMWTNDLYISTLHRAANTSGDARISVPFFTYPQGMTVIACLPTCEGPDNPPRHEPVVAEEYNRVLVEQSARTGRPGVSTRTAGRLRSPD